MDLQQLIPKHKADVETAEKLSSYSYAQVKPIIPQLLIWLQDMNWPVARPVAEYLRQFTEEINPELVNILQGNDEMWKYWIIDVFGSTTTNAAVIKEMDRIAYNPTSNEVDAGVDEIAREVLALRTR
jgi:hypothetical protein